MVERYPEDFWFKIVGALFAAFAFAAAVGSVDGGISRETAAGVARYSLAAVFMGAAWAVVYRPELEKRKLSIRSLFVLVAMQAFGLWLVRITQYGGRPL
jgi:hypothetical protein